MKRERRLLLCVMALVSVRLVADCAAALGLLPAADLGISFDVMLFLGTAMMLEDELRVAATTVQTYWSASGVAAVAATIALASASWLLARWFGSPAASRVIPDLMYVAALVVLLPDLLAKGPPLER